MSRMRFPLILLSAGMKFLCILKNARAQIHARAFHWYFTGMKKKIALFWLWSKWFNQTKTNFFSKWVLNCRFAGAICWENWWTIISSECDSNLYGLYLAHRADGLQSTIPIWSKISVKIFIYFIILRPGWLSHPFSPSNCIARLIQYK